MATRAVPTRAMEIQAPTARVPKKQVKRLGKKSETIPRPRKPESEQEGPTCVVCFEPMVDRVALIPCGHADFCQNCIVEIEGIRPNERKCPSCRADYTTRQRIYINM